VREGRLKLAAQRSVMELVTQVSATLAVFGALGFVAYKAVGGVISIGGLVMYYQAFQRGQGFLREMLSGLARLYENSLFLSDFDEFLNCKRSVPEPVRPRPVPRPLRQGIEFDRVCFGYPQSNHHALEDVSLTVRAGETVALVGENGAGKTTLIKLLCRLYDPTHGRITMDGIDLREFSTTELRREISVLFQDYVRYNVTAKENIGFGDVHRPPSQRDIEEAAGFSDAARAIARLPRGYETILGRQYEEGEELSVGEWQKVALARAFLRQAQIVVLDEPTSALDPRAEHELLERLRQLVSGRTSLIISHRLSTVRFASRIAVLQDGRIVEQGAHDDLLKRGGFYARLFEAQASHYR
jgi:ATP-binding cassette subfamily B protein